MRRQPAKVLVPDDVRLLLGHVRGQRHELRNRVMILLSFKAGMRAAEIAQLDWSMVVASSGEIATHISIARFIAKYRSARNIPINPELARALARMHKLQRYPMEGPVIRSAKGGHMTPRSVVNWFRATYAELGMRGCSSHSGRRTFITRAARLLTKAGGSLRDVQELAGHRSITTTERYIEGDRDAQHKLVRLI